MKYKTYEEHMEKWSHAKETMKKHNEELIKQWRSVPWWKFWVPVPSFEEQRSIIMENWDKFNELPAPRLADYFTFKF